jgi:transposase InsO family protein
MDGEVDSTQVDDQRLARSDPYLCGYLRYFIVHREHSPDHSLSKSRRRRVEEIARSFTFDPKTQQFYFVPPTRASAALPTWLTTPLLVPLPAQRSELIARAHLLGHFGIAATAQRLLRDVRVYWPSLRVDVDRAVRSCGTCLQFRSSPAPHHPARAYQVPGLFHRVAMDLMVGLPEVDGYTNILVITEYLSRYACAFPLRSKTAVEVASKLLEYIFTFGAPKEILSDQGPEFVNLLVELMCSRLNILRRTSSPYHPESNGLAERANRVLITALESCCRENASNWPSMLQYVVFAYRTMPLESLGGYSPFEVMFGRPHNAFLSYVGVPPASSSLPLSLLERAAETRSHLEGLIPTIEKRHQAAKLQQQQQQDTRNAAQLISSPLVVGQVVFARVLTRHRKLRGPQFTGPYKIAKVHAGGNYSLRSPTGQLLRRSYPVDHLRVIAPHIGDNVWRQLTVDKVPPSEVIYVPDRILDHRTHSSGEAEYLIRWEGFSPEFDTWERQSSILSADLIAQYWGVAHSEPDSPPAMLAVPLLCLMQCFPNFPSFSSPPHITDPQVPQNYVFFPFQVGVPSRSPLPPASSSAPVMLVVPAPLSLRGPFAPRTSSPARRY